MNAPPKMVHRSTKYPEGTDQKDMDSKDRYDLRDLHYKLTDFISYKAHYLTEKDVENLI